MYASHDWVLGSCGGDIDRVETQLRLGNVVIGDSRISSQKVCSKHSCPRQLENWKTALEITQSYPRIIPASLIAIMLAVFWLLLLILPLMLGANRHYFKSIGLKVCGTFSPWHLLDVLFQKNIKEIALVSTLKLESLYHRNENSWFSQ